MNYMGKKKLWIKFISFLLCIVIFFFSSVSSISVQAAGKAPAPTGDYEKVEAQNWFRDMRDSFQNWRTNNRIIGDGQIAGSLASALNGDGWLRGYMLGGLLSKDVEYYNQPTKIFDKVNNAYKDTMTSTTAPNSYYYYQGGTTNSTVNNYRVFQDNSNYTTNNYNYQWYNPITNNYNYTDYYLYDTDYNTYYYNQTINNYQYDYYYIDNSTHVTYYIVQTDKNTNEEKEYIYDLYYKLPDGRSSYGLTKEEVWGIYFLYNTDHYDLVAEDDGKTLGLWHFDRNLNDSSFWGNSTGTSINLQYSEGFFEQGKALPAVNYDGKVTTFLPLDKVSFNPTQPYTLEWREFIPGKGNDAEVIFRSEYGSDPEVTKMLFYDYFVFPGKKWVSLQYSVNQFAYYALTFNGSEYQFFINGIKQDFIDRSSRPSEISVDTVCGFKIEKSGITINSECALTYFDRWQYTSGGFVETYIRNMQHSGTIIDEMRLSKGVLYTSNFVPISEPYTTNEVLVLPSNIPDKTLLFYTGMDYPSYRIGGARPTYPANGSIYVSTEEDIVKTIQQYQTNKWVEIDAYLYRDGKLTDFKGFDLNTYKYDEPEDPPDSILNPDKPVDPEPSEPEPSEPDNPDGDGSGGGGLGSLLEGIGKLFSGIVSVLGKLIGMVSDLITGLFDSLSIFTGFTTGFTEFLSATFSFVPPEIWGLITAGITLMILAAVIKMIKG